MYQRNGYTFVSLESALKDKAYSSKQVRFNTNGTSWFYRWDPDVQQMNLLRSQQPKVPTQITQ